MNAATATTQAAHAGPLLLTAEEAAERLSISRTTAYELMRTGVLRSVKIGRSRRIPREALTEFVTGLTEEQGAR